MDYHHAGDIEGAETARLGQAGVTPAAYDFSAPLLTTSIATGGEGEASRLLSENNNEEPPTPLPPVPATILFIVMFLPLIIILGSLSALALSKQDPLGFSFLAFLLLVSLAPCGLGIALLVRVCFFSFQITLHYPFPIPKNGTVELTDPNNPDGNNGPRNTQLFLPHGHRSKKASSSSAWTSELPSAQLEPPGFLSDLLRYGMDLGIFKNGC